MKSYYDRTAKSLPELQEGDKVYFKKMPDTSWITGTIRSKCDQPRSYTVEGSDGFIGRRNREHILKPLQQSPQTVSQDMLQRSPNIKTSPASHTLAPSTEECTPVEMSTRCGRVIRPPRRLDFINMNISSAGKVCITNYNVFAEKFLKQQAKPLWDQNKTYTKEERDAAIIWLMQAVNAGPIKACRMRMAVMRFKVMVEKRLRACLHQCIRQNIPTEVLLHMKQIPTWIKDVEAKVKMLPKLIEECRMSGMLKENRMQTVWADIVHLLVERCHEQRRIPTLEDVQTIAENVGMKNYQLLYRLWSQQRTTALYKFRSIRENGDVAPDMELALTRLEWTVVDLELMYTQDFPLVCLNNKIQPLVKLYQLVLEYKVDESNDVDTKEKWARVVHEYSKKYLTSPSGVVLQRRWWELKNQVHDNIRERIRSVGFKVHPLLVEIAAKYQHIVRERQEEWIDMVKSGKVYDVSSIKKDFDSPDDSYSDSEEEPTGTGTRKSKSSFVIALEGDSDCEEDGPLVIDETAPKNTTDTTPDLKDKQNREQETTKSQKLVDSASKNDQSNNYEIDDEINLKIDKADTIPDLKDNENPEQKTTETEDLDNVPLAPKNDQNNYLNEINSKKDIASTIPDLEEKDKENPEPKTTETQELHNFPVAFKNDQIHDLNETNTIKTIEEEVDSQSNSSNDKETKPEETLMDTYKCSENNINKNNESSTGNAIESDGSAPEDNLVKSNDNFSKDGSRNFDQKENLTESIKSLQKDYNTTTDDSTPKNNIATGIETVTLADNHKESTTNINKPPLYSIKTYSKATPLKIKVTESELRKLEIDFQIEMTKITTIEKKKQGTKKVDDEVVRDSKNPLNSDCLKVTKTYGSKKKVVKSLTQKKNGKMHINKKYEKKVIPASFISNTSDSTKMDVDEGNLAAKCLIENMESNIETMDTNTTTLSLSHHSAVPVASSAGPLRSPGSYNTTTTGSNKTTTETSNDKPEGTIATIYACKQLDGRDLGHVILPASISKDAVTVSTKTNNGTVTIDKVVVNDTNILPVNTHNQPINENVRLCTEIIQPVLYPIPDTTLLTNNSIEPSKQSIETDLDLLQKLDPGQTEELIIFSDSEDDTENVPNKDIKQESVPKIVETNRDDLPKISDTIQENVPNIDGRKDECINLKDVKKYLSNHSLDDILAKMGEIVVRKEATKPEQSVNRICESVIYVSDSDDDTRNNKKLGNSKDVSINNDRTKATKAQSTDQEAKETIVKTDDVVNVPNADVLIIPPHFFSTPMVPTTQSEVPTSSKTTPTLLPTAMVPVLVPFLQHVPAQIVPSPTTNVVPTSIQPSPTVSKPIPNTVVNPPVVLSRAFSIPTPTIDSPTSNVKIPTPNSNVVTLIINDVIGKGLNDNKQDIDESKNLFDDAMCVEDDLTINKNRNSKTTKNKSSGRKPRRTKVYSETAGYSGLFQLKDRSTHETVGMLCRINEEKRIVSEVTEKIDNYLNKFKDTQSNSQKNSQDNNQSSSKSDSQGDCQSDSQSSSQTEGSSQSNSHNQSEFYNIVNKKLETESKKSSSDEFLKTMLQDFQTKTLWTDGDKDDSHEADSDEDKDTTIDPKLIMDTRVYLPKLDEVETYNKNRRVDYSINVKRMSRVGYSILNYKMKSDSAAITDDTEPKSTAPITEHIETEISAALKNKKPGEIDEIVSGKHVQEKSRRRQSSAYESETKDKPDPKLADLGKDLDSLAKRIKKEIIEIHDSIDPARTSAGTNLQSDHEIINSTTEKLKNKRLKQQLLDAKRPNIAQRITFESDDDLNSDDDAGFEINDLNDGSDNSNIISIDSTEEVLKNNETNSNFQENNNKDSELRSDFQETANNKEFDDDNDHFGGCDIFESEDMKLDDEVINNALILDSSVVNTNNTNISDNREEISTKEADEHLKENANIKTTENEQIISTEMETHDISMESDDDDISNRLRIVRKRTLSSDEESSESNEVPLSTLKKSKILKQIVISSDEEDDEISKADKELGIESELQEDVTTKEFVETESGLLKDISRSDDEPEKKSNIEEMMKLCKPFRLCLKKIEVQNDTDTETDTETDTDSDTDTQVRKVELPDKSSLKRHRTPTAHVAPIRSQTDENYEGTPEVTADGDASAADIGNLLQRLTKETANEWQRLEDSVKPKRRRVSNADNSCARKDKKNDAYQNKRKKDDKKEQQKDSDDELDANREWQRQKNINYKFFNFNPINQTMERDPNNTKRKNPKPNRKSSLLVKKVVVNDKRIKQSEVINLDDTNEDVNDKARHNESQNISLYETQAAVESINNVGVNTNTDVGTIKTAEQCNKVLNIVPKGIKLTPIFTTIEQNIVEADDENVLTIRLPKTIETSNDLMPLAPKPTETFFTTRLIPIATKVEQPRKEPETEEPSRPVRHLSTKLRNSVQVPKTHKNNSDTSSGLPSTSKHNIISPRVPVPSTSKASNLDLICISDDSNDISELTQTTSVRNYDSNVTNNEKSTQSRTSIPSTSIINPPSKVFDTNHLNKKDYPNLLSSLSNPPLKMMEIGPIKCNSSDLNESSRDKKQNTNAKNNLQIMNVTLIPTTQDHNNRLTVDENKEGNNETDQSTPRLRNVMSVQSIDSNVTSTLVKTLTNSAKEKSERGICEIQSVISIPSDDEKISSPVNSFDELDSDSFHIDEDLNSSSDVDVEIVDQPSTSKDLRKSNLKADDNAQDNEITVLQTSSKKKEGSQFRPNVNKLNIDANIPTINIDDDEIDPRIAKSDSCNIMTSGISNISNVKSVKLQQSLLKKNIHQKEKDVNSCDEYDSDTPQIGKDSNSSSDVDVEIVNQPSTSKDLGKSNSKTDENAKDNEITILQTSSKKKAGSQSRPNVIKLNSVANISTINIDDDKKDTRIAKSDSCNIMTGEISHISHVKSVKLQQSLLKNNVHKNDIAVNSCDEYDSDTLQIDEDFNSSSDVEVENIAQPSTSEDPGKSNLKSDENTKDNEITILQTSSIKEKPSTDYKEPSISKSEEASEDKLKFSIGVKMEVLDTDLSSEDGKIDENIGKASSSNIGNEKDTIKHKKLDVDETNNSKTVEKDSFLLYTDERLPETPVSHEPDNNTTEKSIDSDSTVVRYNKQYVRKPTNKITENNSKTGEIAQPLTSKDGLKAKPANETKPKTFLKVVPIQKLRGEPLVTTENDTQQNVTKENDANKLRGQAIPFQCTTDEESRIAASNEDNVRVSGSMPVISRVVSLSSNKDIINKPSASSQPVAAQIIKLNNAGVALSKVWHPKNTAKESQRPIYIKEEMKNVSEHVRTKTDKHDQVKTTHLSKYITNKHDRKDGNHEVIDEIRIDLEFEKMEINEKPWTREENQNELVEEESESDELPPTFTEKEMELIKQCLEEGDNGKDIRTTINTDENQIQLENQKSKRSKIRKSFIDFVSDEEDVSDSTSWKDSGDDTSSSETNKRKKKKVVKKRKVTIITLDKGQEYSKKSGPLARPKSLQPNPCLEVNCYYNCKEISEEKRKNIFDFFWGLSPQQQKDWLATMISRAPVKRKLLKFTYQYYINDGVGRRQVCKKFMVKTLDVYDNYFSQNIFKESSNIPAKRLDFAAVSPHSPLSISEFIKNKDCTNISLLCMDEWKSLWKLNGEYYVLTNLKLPMISPTYWTVGPRDQCTRIIIDDNSSGSTVVGSLLLPDEVFLDNNWYKKLTKDPMIYAKIWFVVPDVATCKEMLNCNVQMQVMSRVTGAILPLAVHTIKTLSKPAHYRINANNLNSLQLPELATLIKTSVQTGKPAKVVLDVVRAPKDPKLVTKPVTSDEVINVDSDDE